jgi:hypothetical protein
MRSGDGLSYVRSCHPVHLRGGGASRLRPNHYRSPILGVHLLRGRLPEFGLSRSSAIMGCASPSSRPQPAARPRPATTVCPPAELGGDRHRPEHRGTSRGPAYSRVPGRQGIPVSGLQSNDSTGYRTRRGGSKVLGRSSTPLASVVLAGPLNPAARASLIRRQRSELAQLASVQEKPAPNL